MTSAAPLPPLAVPVALLHLARANCAARLRARGHEAEAGAFELGERDFAWAMRHEAAKLQAERGE